MNHFKNLAHEDKLTVFVAVVTVLLVAAVSTLLFADLTALASNALKVSIFVLAPAFGFGIVAKSAHSLKNTKVFSND